MKNKETIKNFTEGSVVEHMLIFAAPLFLSNLLQAVYNVVDMIIVGHAIGKTGLSAISVGGDVQNFLTFLAMGFSNAGQIIIAQHIGADMKKKLPQIVGNLCTLLFSCAIGLSILSFLIRRPILNLMNTPSEVYDYALSYATTCIIGLVFIYGYNVISAILRGMGDSKHPFLFIAMAAILNVILDLIFIIHFQMGPFGAALATVISQGVSFLSGVIFLFQNRRAFHLQFTEDDFRIDPAVTMMILRLGVPMAIKTAAVQVTKLFVNSSVNVFGVIASSASGIESKLSMITNLISNAVNVACSTMIGQNIGAGKYQRISKIMRTAYKITLLVCVVLTGLVCFLPSVVFGLFTTDTEVLSALSQMKLLLFLVFSGSAVRTPNNGLIDGSGNYKLNFAVAILDGIVNRMFFAILLGRILGMGWIGYLYGDAIAGFTPFVIGGFYYLSGKWKTRHYVTS